MKLNLKASVYASMVEVEGNLVSVRKSGRISIIAPIGACSSLVTSTREYPSANTRYRYNEIISCNGVVIGVTEYRQVTVDGGAYTVFESTPYVTHLQ